MFYLATQSAPSRDFLSSLSRHRRLYNASTLLYVCFFVIGFQSDYCKQADGLTQILGRVGCVNSEKTKTNPL